MVDVIGFGIVIPVLPYYVSSFGASPFVITLLFAVFAFFSFFSTPLLGSLSDRIGRRPVLIISILSTSIGWFVFAGAKGLIFLFLGRIIDGLAAGNFSTAQSYLVDIAKDDKERTTNLGLIGAVFGLGFIIGPLLGGLLSAVSHAFPFWFVGGLALINATLAFFLLPETNKSLKKDQKIRLNPLTPLVKAAKDKKQLPLYSAWLLFGLAMAGYQSVFALYLDKVFGYQELVAGLIFTGLGAIIALNQLVGLKHFWLKYFPEPTLELWLLFLCAMSFLLMSFNWLAVFIIGLLAITFGQSVLRVIITSQVVGRAEATAKGETLGIMSSLISVGMIVGPLISGLAFQWHHRYSFLISAAYVLLAFFIILGSRQRLSKTDLPEDVEINQPL